MTATQAITRALRILGYMRQGMTPPTDLLNEGLDALNDLVGTWRTQSLLVFSIAANLYTLIASQQNYTIGPSGANFTAARPTWIKDANLVLNNVSPVVRIPFAILRDSEEWAAIRVRGITSSIPLALYYEPTAPNGILHLWPVPTRTYQIELFTWAQLTTFADLTTNYSFPPGYENALKWNLALEMASLVPFKLDAVTAPTIGRQNRLGLIQQKASEYKAAIKSLNAPTLRLVSDAAMVDARQGGYFNYRTGNIV